MTKLVLISIGLVGFLGIITSGLTTKTAAKTTNILPSSNDFTVIELFTSQGCSSCPVADDILRGLADRENVMALSFHVTYWNRLGWADPFSKPEFDERQYNYGSHFKLNSVYTPQVVINGEIEMVGSHGDKIEKELKKMRTEKNDIKIDLTTKLIDTTKLFKMVNINYKINKDVKNYLLNIALVERNIETKVTKGENSGRTLKHDNVVRLFKTVKMGENTEGSEKYLMNSWFDTKNGLIIVYLQDEKTLKIVAASKMEIN
jgi:hypothetical protein